MKPLLKTWVQEHKHVLDKATDWTLDQKAAEMAQWALEEGYGELPELDIYGGWAAQREYDQLVEEAYSWLLGECKEYLK